MMRSCFNDQVGLVGIPSIRYLSTGNPILLVGEEFPQTESHLFDRDVVPHGSQERV